MNAELAAQVAVLDSTPSTAKGIGGVACACDITAPASPQAAALAPLPPQTVRPASWPTLPAIGAAKRVVGKDGNAARWQTLPVVNVNLHRCPTRPSVCRRLRAKLATGRWRARRDGCSPPSVAAFDGQVGPQHLIAPKGGWSA